MNWRRFAIWASLIGVAVALIVMVALRTNRWRPRAVSIQGAVVRRDSDTRKQLPISDAVVTARDGAMKVSTQSDASGYFNLNFKENVWPGQRLILSFRSPDYKPLDMTLVTGLRLTTKKLYVAELTPVTPEETPRQAKKAVVVSNMRIRYTVNTQGVENIASAVRTFQVINEGNVPCNRQAPCSPDGDWKAATGSTTIDAGPDNEFRDVRASCIAGPCPFTRIDTSGFAQGGRTVTVTALDWSDTATFLLEAEVFRTSINSSVRQSYPVVFGQTLNFTLPPTEEGVSIEAELDGTPMVFPLGPNLYLSWATCTARTNREMEKSTVYRCELKPGYRF
jgi:hypothetical protein